MAMRLSRAFRSLVSVLFLLFSLLVLTISNPAHGANDRTALAGSVPSWANSKNLQSAADPATSVGFRVYLGWTDPDGAAALARAVSDPSNASYGKYLTPTQFRARFAPSAADTAKVKNWLKSQGFAVEYVPQNNHYISA